MTSAPRTDRTATKRSRAACTTPVAIHELSRGRRLAILMISCTSLFIVGIDITGVNIALPSIGRDVHAGVAGLQWVVDAYTVVLASLLMLSGSLADRFGRRRVFATGLATFSLASLLCSLAPDAGLLIAFRALQAVGGSMLTPVAMSIITNTFLEPRERAQAIGMWSAAFGISMALGPIIGGALVSSIGWRAIFDLNLPTGLAAILLTLRFIPESKAPAPRRFDPVGQALMITTLAALTYAIIEAPSHGWGAPQILTAFAVSAASFLAVMVYEPRRQQPLIDLRFFRSIPFSAAIVTSIAAFAAFGGFLFLNTLYLQEVRGFSPIIAGLATLPMAAMTTVASPVSGRIVSHQGPRGPLIAAGLGLAAGSLMLTRLRPATPLPLLFAAYVVFGTGFGLVNAPITNTAVSGMPRAQAGVAAATATTSRQFGQTLGVAIAGAIVTSRARVAAGTGLAAASHPAWWALAACGTLVMILGAIATSVHARASAARTAKLLNPDVLTP
jgi:EmrB/QacA subfamily drug resistance transporter